MHWISSAIVLAACGSVVAADRTPQLLGLDHLGEAQPSGHIYVNLVSGEHIFTREHPTPVGRGERGVGGAGRSGPVWMADNAVPCAAYGLNTRLIHRVDQPDLDPGDPFYALRLGAIYLDWGDIAFDTVVDAVGVAYATRHADQDLDGDGFPDGVEGFGATWVWLDQDNGFNSCDGQLYVTSFTLHGLPGSDQPDTNQFALYFLTVDLASGFDQSRTFELGDTDHDSQGAAYYNAAGGEDLDDDGLHDFSHFVLFHQPGTRDFDGDGQPDGDPDAVAGTGILLVAPSGPAMPDPTVPGRYIIDPVDPPPAAQGLEDIYNIYESDGAYFATFWYNGFSCDRDGNGIPGDQPNDYRPFASFYQQLYGPGGHVQCWLDMYPPPIGDGVLNFFDMSYFLARFGVLDPLVDIFPPGGDGEINFFDLVEYINAFMQGCL